MARDLRPLGAGPGGGDTGGMRETPDIRDRHDLDVLLRRFYGAAFADPLIGPFFTEVAGTDLEVHLPHIADFWERALLRTADYGRDPFAPHAALHTARPLTAAHFGRWVQLWHASVDGLHAGPRAERAKAQGERIALVLLKRLGGGSTEGTGGGFVPLAALELRSVA
jgi:hemoglobin